MSNFNTYKTFTSNNNLRKLSQHLKQKLIKEDTMKIEHGYKIERVG